MIWITLRCPRQERGITVGDMAELSGHASVDAGEGYPDPDHAARRTGRGRRRFPVRWRGQTPSKPCFCFRTAAADRRMAMVAMICVPLTLGVWIRVRVPNFYAADISFEATIADRPAAGAVRRQCWAGLRWQLPAMWHGEYWTLPVNLAVAGHLRRIWPVRRARKTSGRSPP